MLRNRCGVALMLLAAPGCGSSPSSPTPPPSPAGPPAAAIEAAVREAYQRELGVNVPKPAIFNDPQSQNCAGAGHLTTTTYLRTGSNNAVLQFLYMSRDASAVIRTDRPVAVVAPSGTFRVLVVVVQHVQTIGAGSLASLEAGQRQINDDHAAFARARSFAEPIVRFESTNVAIDPARIENPRSRGSIVAAAEAAGISTAGYHFVMSLNIDPARSEGGFAALADRFVYVGNFRPWSVTLSEGDWRAIARTAYHHEVAHHWGWPATHDWSPTCGGTSLGFEPLIAAPVLFGWEDVDGDGVPEILDPTPYGRSS